MTAHSIMRPDSPLTAHSFDGVPSWLAGSGGETIVADPVLWVHVLAGVVALLAGAAAIVTAKGGPRHNRAGKLYGLTMAVVVVTAFPLSIRADSWFLFAIAAFSGYLVAAGYRVVLRRRAGVREPEAVDHALHGTMVVVSVVMIAAGGYGSLTGVVDLGPVLAVFGLIGGVLAVRELRELRVSAADRTPWFERHVAFMGGGYIATVTAAVTVNLTAVPPLVRWLGPTLVGVPLILHAIRTYEPRFGRPTG